MESNKIALEKSFITGELYSIGEIFSNNHRLVIPDLQRDYCWGSNKPDSENKVYSFVDNLNKLYKNHKDSDTILGLFYGYEENELNPGSIMLCDGQQRLTTIFLLLGMLNRECQNEFENFLMSEFERMDDHEPFIHYAIRGNSLNFPRDLTWNFFLLNEGKSNVKDICVGKSWYYHQYDLDPTIISIKNALSTIEAYISNPENNINTSDFARFIVRNLKMMYYDMGNRENGEETFVVINTSGEPLSSVENLKPLIVHNTDECEKWEEMEEWFWFNRNCNYSDTSDNGMREFLRCVYYLEGGSLGITKETRDKILTSDSFIFPYENISLETIIEYFKAYKRLNIPPLQKRAEPKKYSWLLPTLRFAKRFSNASLNEIAYFKEVFINLQSYKNDNAKVLDFGLKAAKGIDSSNFLDLLKLESIRTFDTEGELQLKLGILKSAYQKESSIDDATPLFNIIYTAFREDEGHAVLYGQIRMLIDFAGGAGNFDFERYKNVRNKFYLFFYNPSDSWDRYVSKNVLRYLLMNNLHHHLNEGQYLQWIGSSWRDKILSDDKSAKLYNCMTAVSSENDIRKRIDEFRDNLNNRMNFYYPIITDTKWLDHSQYNSFHRIGDRTVPMCVVRYKSRQQHNHDDWYLIGSTRLRAQEHGKDWSNFWYNQRFLYITNNTKNIGINIHADGSDDSRFYAFVYNHPQPNIENTFIREITMRYNLQSPKKDGYFKIGPFPTNQSENFVSQIKAIMDTIDSM